jgi:hypothetical protein
MTIKESVLTDVYNNHWASVITYLMMVPSTNWHQGPNMTKTVSSGLAWGWVP